MQLGKYITHGSKSVLHRLTENMIAEILDLDQQQGNDAGKEMIDQMVRFFGLPPPPDKHTTMEDFFLYRRKDAAFRYILACTKFSLNSCVDTDSPGFAKLIGLLENRILVANDIASWDKEKRVYDTGKAQYLINTVAVVAQLFSLDTSDAAIVMAQALQYQIECDIDKEIQRLVAEDSLAGE